MKWFEVKAINKCGNVEHSHFSSWGPDIDRDVDESIAIVVESVRRQHPGCEIVVEKS